MPLEARRSTLVVTLILLTVVSPQAAQSPGGRLSTTVVNDSNLLALDLPADDISTFETLRLVLQSSGLTFGLESSAPKTDVAPVDFAHPPSDSVQLTGLSIERALDAAARANPRLRWTRMGDFPVVRLVPAGQGFLDRRVARYNVINASPFSALIALIGVLDPGRRTDTAVQGMGRPAAGRVGEPPTRIGKNVTLTLENETVLTILNSIVRANGAMSWMVTYSHAPASYETATITFTESGESAIAPALDAIPVFVTSLASVGGRPPMTVPVTGDVSTMVQMYSSRAGVRTASEQIAAFGSWRPRLPQLNVTGLEPAKALARIVAFDSRFEMFEKDGVFHVRPKAGASNELAVLGRIIDSFSVAGVTLDAALVQLMERLGARSPGRLGGAPVSSTGQPSPFATIVSVTIDKPTPAREVINALCQAAGMSSWSARGNLAPNETQMSIAFAVSSPQGSMSSRGSFTLPVEAPPPRPTRTSTVALPPAADRMVQPLSVPLDDPPGAFTALAAAAGVGLGVEGQLPPPRDPDPRVMTRSVMPQMLALGAGSLRDSLLVLLERFPDYEMANDRGFISIAPAALLNAPDHFMNRRIGKFEISGVGVREAVTLLRQRLNPIYPRASPSGGPMRSMSPVSVLDRPLTLSLSNPTPREVLNALAAQHGEIGWSSTYSGRTPWESAQARESDWTVVISAVSAGALPSGRPAYGNSIRIPPVADPSAPPPPPRPANLPAGTIGGGRATVDLPITPRRLSTAIDNIARLTRTPFAMETVRQPTPGLSSLGSEPQSREYYDLTGLSIPEALDKLAGLQPTFTWYQRDGVFHVRSLALADAKNLPLDRRVDAMNQRFDGLDAAMAGIRTLLSAPTGGLSTLSSLGGPASRTPPKIISVNVTNVTVRELLDAMILNGGDMSWSVEYLGANGIYPQIALTLRTFDGQAYGSTIVVR